MKPSMLVAASLCVVGTMAVLFTPDSDAQQNVINAPAQNNVDTPRAERDRPGGTQVGVLDDQTSGANFRASQLIGMNIENEKGEGVGEVNDLVIDGNAGTVRYVAVTYGGLLGVGDKMFAVPFEAFKVRRQAGDRDDYVLTLNVTQQQLEGRRASTKKTGQISLTAILPVNLTVAMELIARRPETDRGSGM